MLNIDDIHFNQISLSTDSLALIFKDRKKDKKSEKASLKNCYVNPFKFEICICIALEILLCLRDISFTLGIKSCVFRRIGKSIVFYFVTLQHSNMSLTDSIFFIIMTTMSKNPYIIHALLLTFILQQCK